MSGFDLIPSGIPPGPDVTDSPDVRGVMTQVGSQSLHDRLPHSSTYDDNIIVWASARLAENLGKWSSKRGPISKIRPSDGCGRDAVTLAVERWYDFPNLGVIWEMLV